MVAPASVSSVTSSAEITRKLGLQFERGFGCRRQLAIHISAGSSLSWSSNSVSWNITERGLSGSMIRSSMAPEIAKAVAIAAAMGHDAVANLEQHFGGAFGRVIAAQPACDLGNLDAALKPAADFEKAPAREPVHVFMHEAGKPGELAQQDRHGPGGVVAGLDALWQSAGRFFAGP